MKPELINSLKNYKKKNVFNDLFAGLMVAIIALPLSIALGIQSVPKGAPINGIQCGIITAIIAGFLISALGGSKFQIGGPTAAFVVILYGYLANPDIGVLGLAIAGIMAGVLLIIMGFCKCGSVMKFFPYPITIGFTTGIGVTLLVGQIKDLCGLTAGGEDVIRKIISYVNNIGTLNWGALLVGVVGLMCVIGLPRISKKIPSAFVALIVCTGLTFLLNDVAGVGVPTIGSAFGEVQAGFVPINFSGIGSVKFTALIIPAIVIAFLCAIESLLSATVASGMTNTTFNANQELIGQGVANICSSLLGGLPATGAIARTAAGIENGAKSPLTGMFHSVFILIMYFALMGVVKFIPLSVFSAILISVAINMSRFKLFAKLSIFGVRDSVILWVTCILTIVFDLTYGVLAGVGVTALMNALNYKKGLKIAPAEESGDKVVKCKGALYFINANKLVNELSKRVANSDSVTLDLSQVESIDQTALEKICTFNKKLKAENKTLIITGENQKIKTRLQKYFNVL